MSLLSLNKLTMRFGGLTAVNGVDVSVEEGKIVSIIGPNGAGKTTVFNAITGIYEPTEGEIRFRGHVLMRPRTPWVWLSCAAIGLLTGVLAMLLVANVDQLWHAAIKRNYPTSVPFTYSAAVRDAVRYLLGEPGLEAHAENWNVMSADGAITLMRNLPRDEAEKTRDLFARIARGESPSPDLDEKTLALVRQSAAMGARRSAYAKLALLLGTLLGTAGAYAIWSRARRTPDIIARGGIARTFQNIRLFQNMTALENVLIGLDQKESCSVLGLALNLPYVRRLEALATERAKCLLDFVGLKAAGNSLAKNLPYGQQRRLEIARALATEPKLILLDEPAAGMNPTESEQLTGLIRQIRERGITVLLIEHHMRVVMGISDHITVLDYGSKIAEGTPAQVRANPAVIKAYLGSEEVT
jgi:ABC-type branched-subunit amino acid transport system ATPase component